MTTTMNRLLEQAEREGLSATMEHETTQWGREQYFLKIRNEADPLRSYLYIIAMYSDVSNRWTHTAYRAPQAASRLQKITLRSVRSWISTMGKWS